MVVCVTAHRGGAHRGGVRRWGRLGVGIERFRVPVFFYFSVFNKTYWVTTQ